MPDARPKLFIVSGDRPVSDELLRGLGDRFDVVVSGGATIPLDAGPADPSLLLNALDEGVALLSAGGGVLWSNARFVGLPAEVRSAVESAARDAGAWLEQVDSVPADPHELERVYPITEPGARLFEATIMPELSSVQDDAGAARFARLVAAVRDVTAEEASRRRMEAIDRAGAELVRLDPEVVRKLNAPERLDLLEEKIHQYCRELLHFDHVIIRLLDERTGRLELITQRGFPAEALELTLYAKPEGNGISGHVASTGKSYICADTEHDPLFLPGVTGARSSLTVPLRVNDKVVGTLDVESLKPHAFGEPDLPAAEAFARYIALALHTLNLLVVERSATNQTVSTRVEGELHEPLDDIIHELDSLRSTGRVDAETARHLDKIRADVDAIRRRVKNVATGPQTLLGVEKALAERGHDPVLAGRRVLVADDDANMRRIIHDVLENRGCEVVACEDGEHAVTVLAGVVGGSVRPFNAVLSDIQMPDRNGYEVFAASKKAMPAVPVILMTGFGYDPHHSIVRASQEGLQSVLFKPFQVERLLDEIRKAIMVTG